MLLTDLCLRLWAQRFTACVATDPTVTYCPRESCNAPVPKEKDDAYERLRICPKCSYTFCCYCRRTYHGTKSRCVFSQAESIVDKYVNGTEEEKTMLETRYGKTNVQKLVDTYLEEQANAKWIADNSTRCPDCQVRALSYYKTCLPSYGATRAVALTDPPSPNINLTTARYRALDGMRSHDVRTVLVPFLLPLRVSTFQHRSSEWCQSFR